MSYIGTQPVPQSLESRQEFTSTASQTTFVTSGYTVGYVDVYLNGVKLSTSDFTATNGSDVVLGSGAAAGDVLAVVMKNDHSDLVALPITDSQGNNVLSESGGTVTLTADEANVGSNALVVDSSGNVGIGTSSPNEQLDVIGDIQASSAVKYGSRLLATSAAADGSATAPSIPVGYDFDTGLFRPDTNVIGITTAGTERMRIDASGSVGIGTIIPNGKLHVQEGANLSESYPHIKIVGSGYQSYHWLDATAYYIGQNSSIRSLRLYSGAETAGVNLAASGTSWGTFSDERLKYDIEPITDGLTKLSNVRCVSYRLKDVDAEDSQKKLGVIAQDLVGLVDEVIDTTTRSGDDTEYMSIRYTELIPVLVKAIQEQQTLIESQQSQIDALTARIEALETT